MENHPPSNVSNAKMIVFQTPTHPVIISNFGWCFFVENFVETFKDVAKVEHLWKKRETTLENLLHNKIFGFSPWKKNKPLFSKSFVSNILCPKNKKNFSENFLLKKQVLILQNEKEKEGLYLQSFDLNDKTLLFLFKAKFAYCQKQNREHLPLEKKTAFFFVLSFSELFFLPSFQNEGSKKQTNEVRSFFSFCQDNNVVVQDNETFFCFTIVQNQQALGNCLWLKQKKTLFFLLEKLRSYVCAKKVWTSEICNEK